MEWYTLHWRYRMEERNHTSYSEASLFMRCQYAHHLRYTRGLKRIQEADHLRLGSLVDTGLQAALHVHSQPGPEIGALACVEAIDDATTEYLEQDHVAEFADATPPEGGPTIREQASALMDKACKIAQRTIIYLELGTDKWTTLIIDGKPAIQTELKCDIPGSSKHMIGYLDWVATNREGETYIIDFKVRKKRQSEEEHHNGLEDDWQLPLYAYALAEKGVDIKGVAHLNIYGQVPKQPKVNKNGTISQAACDTDWETYAEAVRQAGGDPNMYLKMREKLDAKSWINWTQRYITEHERTFAFMQIVKSATEIRIPGPIPARTIFPMTCRMCDFQSYCRLDRQGYNAQGLIGTEYYIRGEESSLVNIQRLPVVEGDRNADDER